MRNFILTMAMFVVALAVFSKNNVAECKLLPADYEGTMMPYSFSEVHEKAIWPDSLHPVYLAHVARHGARYISSPKKLEKLQKAIRESKDKGSLTNKGVAFEKLLCRISEVSDGRWGALSEEGCREEKGIAKNLNTLMPSFFRDARVRAISSYVPRVVMTMYEFCHQLAWMSPDVRINTSEGKEFDVLLRCFEADPEYDRYRSNGEWKILHDSIIDAKVSPEPARRILGEKAGLSDSKLRKLTMEIYDVLQSLEAFGMPRADERYMTGDEFKSCWEVDNIEHYLRNAITPYSDMAGRATAPLLAKILADADESLDSRRLEQTLKEAAMYLDEMSPEAFDANLYFGHAETLMPLLSLMKVDGCSCETSDLSILSREWRDYDIVPLGAHLDIIILECPSGLKMVALQLNGKFLPPISGGPLIEKWETYRTYLIGLI
ncbi:MAG: hypothetical protein NC095_09235 [Muribaculum sp.]|nr:hypothetical protein [Muribaculum sp.]